MRLALGPAVIGLLNLPSFVRCGPYSMDIARTQELVDARLLALAAHTSSAPETTAARLHRQPTPSSISRAEEESDHDPFAARALAAIERARRADERGDAKGCGEALAEIRKLMSDD